MPALKFGERIELGAVAAVASCGFRPCTQVRENRRSASRSTASRSGVTATPVQRRHGLPPDEAQRTCQRDHSALAAALRRAARGSGGSAPRRRPALTAHVAPIGLGARAARSFRARARPARRAARRKAARSRAVTAPAPTPREPRRSPSATSSSRSGARQHARRPDEPPRPARATPAPSGQPPGAGAASTSDSGAPSAASRIARRSVRSSRRFGLLEDGLERGVGRCGLRSRRPARAARGGAAPAGPAP